MKFAISHIYIRLKYSALFKDSFWALTGSVIGKGLSLLAGIFIARFLGKETFGEYGVIKNTLVYISIVSTFGFGYTATHFIAKNIINEKNNIYTIVNGIYIITLSVSIVLSLFLFTFAKPISIFIEAEQLADSLRTFSITIIFNAICTSQIGILSGFKAFKEIAKNNTYSGIIVFVLSIILTYYYNINGAIFALLASFVFQTIINVFSIHKYLKSYNKIIQNLWPKIKTMCNFSLPVALQESLYSIIHWLSIYLLLKYGNYGEIGILSAANQWSAMVIFIPGVLKNVMFSYLSSAKEHTNLINRLLTINFIATILPFSFVILFSDFISSFYGTTFANLKPVLIVSVFSSIFVCLSEVYCYEFISIGKTWLVFYMRLARDIIILFFSFIFFTIYSQNQALILVTVTTIMSIIYLFLLAMYYYRNKFKRILK